MTLNLLPPAFNELTQQAVHIFWHSRSSGAVNASTGDGRTAVVSGKNMDGFVEVVRSVVKHYGLSEDTVHVRRSKVVLPGFFRATKNWDVLVVHEKRGNSATPLTLAGIKSCANGWWNVSDTVPQHWN